jgi:hypothetical protein
MNQRLPRATANANIMRNRTEVTRGNFRSSSHTAPAGLDISRASRRFFLRSDDEVDISVPPSARVGPSRGVNMPLVMMLFDRVSDHLIVMAIVQPRVFSILRWLLSPAAFRRITRRLCVNVLHYYKDAKERGFCLSQNGHGPV